MNVLLVEAVVKGYHEFPFTVRTGESFSLEKKIGSREEAFRVLNCEKVCWSIREKTGKMAGSLVI